MRLPALPELSRGGQMNEHGLSAAASAREPEGERRQITIFFCDLVDSTALSSRLDPEDLDHAMRQFRAVVLPAIEHFGGLVVRYMGDGMLAYFGYPTAQEDAPAAAVRAGLAALRRIDELHFADGSQARLRVAAATGMSVVGDLVGSRAASEVGVSGMVANLAARILSLCHENTMLIADATRELAGDEFDYLDFGEHQLKGIDGLVKVWQPLFERTDHRRYEVPSKTTAFVGREQEMQMLAELWGRALDRQGQLVLVRGEAGIGKTALLRHFERSLADRPFVRVLLQCSSHHTDSPLYPLTLHIQRAAGIDSQDSATVRLEKIEAMVPAEDAAHSVPLLAELLSIPTGGRYAALALSPVAKKAATLQLFVKSTRELARANPVLLLVEDAHWIDPTSEELASILAAELANERVLVVVAARPEYQPAWERLGHVCSMALSPLSDFHTRDLVTQSAAAGPLHAAIIEQIVARSGGIPLFAEELARTMADGQTGGGALLGAHIPTTLRDSLMGRIDRLGEYKQLVQTAAVLGRRFSASMLQAVGIEQDSNLPLPQGLQGLLKSGLIVAVGDRARPEYVFKHALIRDCAYDSLLRARRQRIHGRIAESMESRLGYIVVSEPEVLAHHWTSANRAERAVPYWLQSAQRCVGRGANVEAIRHVQEGIRLLDHLPVSIARDRLEFYLRVALGQAAYVVDGPAATRTTSAYARAQGLLDSVDDSDQRMAVLYGIFSSYHFASRFDLAREPAGRALEMAERESNPFFLCQAHRMLGYIAFFTGDCGRVHEHFTALSAAYDPSRHAPLAARYGADCQVGAAGFYSLVKCIQGRVDEALEMSRKNIAYATSLAHAASLGWAYASAGYLHYYLQDREAAHATTAEGIAHCAAHNIGSWLVHCRAFNVWAAAGLHPGSGHAAEMREVIATAAAGNALGLPLLRTALAEVLLLQDEVEEALEVIDLAMTEVHATSQLFFEPNVCIVRRKCLQRLGHIDLADEAAAQARAAADRMDASYLIRHLG